MILRTLQIAYKPQIISKFNIQIVFRRIKLKCPWISIKLLFLKKSINFYKKELISFRIAILG